MAASLRSRRTRPAPPSQDPAATRRDQPQSSRKTGGQQAGRTSTRASQRQRLEPRERHSQTGPALIMPRSSAAPITRANDQTAAQNGGSGRVILELPGNKVILHPTGPTTPEQGPADANAPPHASTLADQTGHCKRSRTAMRLCRGPDHPPAPAMSPPPRSQVEKETQR